MRDMVMSTGNTQEAQQHSVPGTAQTDAAMPAVESTSLAVQQAAPQDAEAMEIEEAGRGYVPARLSAYCGGTAWIWPQWACMRLTSPSCMICSSLKKLESQAREGAPFCTTGALCLSLNDRAQLYVIACTLKKCNICRKQEGLGVSKKSMKPTRKQSSVLNRPLHEKRKKGKKKPRAWFHGE